MIRKAAVVLLVTTLPLLSSGCVRTALQAGVAAGTAAIKASRVSSRGPERSQLEIRELQTRMFDTADTKGVLKTMLSVLQDDGFIVTQANTELGFLSGSKAVDVQTKSAVFWGSFLKTGWNKNATVEVTANVSAYGDQTRVRANFQTKTFDSNGNVSGVAPVEDPKFYQEFFAKMDKGLFIDKEEL